MTKACACPSTFGWWTKARAKPRMSSSAGWSRKCWLGATAPALVTADSWYSGVENLKFLRKQGLGFLIGLEENRIVSEHPHEYVPVEALALPQSGKVLHLREFGFVSVFRTVDKNNAVRHYAQYDPRKKSA